jgi:hypothetical protein
MRGLPAAFRAAGLAIVPHIGMPDTADAGTQALARMIPEDGRGNSARHGG